MINGELIVDNFAGGGGASTGIEMATGISVDIAINHDPEAIKMHKANHPSTTHYCESVWDVNPIEACKGHPVALAWFSPDCKHFSKAKGGKPKDKNIRGLAWVALRWAGLVRPRVIMIEKGDTMTEFEVDAIFNTICRPGLKVRIRTKIGCSEDHIPVRMWKHWTVVKKYDNHVLMISRAGYCESFTIFDIKDMIIKGEIRWRD